jgi:propanol-preferring alcohol dehydrogenase
VVGSAVRAAVLREVAEIYVEGLPRRYPNLKLVEEPLSLEEVPVPVAGPNQVLVRVSACGVCYTDVDIVEGRVLCKLPLIPGHQVVGRVVEVGKEYRGPVSIGDVVGIAWVGWTCGVCRYCREGLENLCESFRATGCHIDGGYAEYTVAYGDYVYRIPKGLDEVHAAPLLCAGAVGYRALKLAGVSDGHRVGLFGFGASAHIIIQVLRSLYPSVEVYVFSRSAEHRDLAKRLGADWVGAPSEEPPKRLDRAIDFTPVGEMVSRALKLLGRGGRLVVNVIRKQTPIQLDYADHLWLEREVKSVANVTRGDVEELLSIAGKYGVKTEVQVYSLDKVNRALVDLKAARVRGSAVLRVA